MQVKWNYTKLICVEPQSFIHKGYVNNQNTNDYN